MMVSRQNKPVIRRVARSVARGLALGFAACVLVAAGPCIESSWASKALPPPPQTQVYDETGLTSPEWQSALGRTLAKWSTQSQIQILIAVFQSLDGEEIGDYTNRVYNHWKIGQDDKGALIALYRSDRKLRIEVGYGLESVLTDARSKQVIDQIIAPHLKLGNFEQGLQAGALALINIVQDPNSVGRPTQSSHEPNSKVEFLFLLLIVLSLLVSRLVRSRSGTTLSGRYGRRNTFGGGFGGFGGGSSSGGFGGFSGGGGSSGGGGASGSW